MKQAFAVPSRLFFAIVLFAAFAAFLMVTYRSDPDLLFRRAASFYAFAQAHAWLLMGLYVLRPLFLLPASFVILLTGMMFGSIGGELVAVAGLTLGGAIEFFLARSSIAAVLGAAPPAVVVQLQRRINRAPFRAVLLLRLCFVPFDIVTLAAALARAPLGAFVAATALGVIPTSLPIVLSGAALNFQAWFAGGQLWPRGAALTWPWIALSFLLAALTVVLARRSDRGGG